MGLIRLAGAALIAALGLNAQADPLRIATYGPDLSRDGPGLLLRDLTRTGKKADPQIAAVVQVIVETRPDILLLTDIDWDYDGLALTAFADLLAKAGLDYPHRFAARPNAGMATDLDLNGDGRLGSADDAQGFGEFTGQGGMAILSRHPIGPVTDYSDALWRDLPGNLIGDALTPDAAAAQRLSTNGHWDVEILTQPPLHLLAFAATAPVFDGPEDRNGRRNHDEIAFWATHLPDAPFVLAGNANLDPVDGDGRKDAIRALLADPRLTDPLPRSDGAKAAADADQKGDPSLDTADWPDGKPGNLRVTYVLPASGLTITGSGTFWPAEGQPLSQAAATASPHKLVWLDLEIGG